MIDPDHQKYEGLPKSGVQRSFNGEVDMQGLLNAVWRYRRLILLMSISAGLVAVLFVSLLPNVYRAEALLAPSESPNSDSISALSGQLSGLASLAGVGIGRGDSNKVAIGLEVLQSRSFLIDFIQRRGILAPLMAGKKKWKNILDLFANEKDGVNDGDAEWSEVMLGDEREPTSLEAYDEFRRNLSVERDKSTGLVTVSMMHPSPQLAKVWVEWLIDDLNANLRSRDIKEAKASIDYLKGEADRSSVADMQKVFYQLIEKQMQTVMLAKVRDEYAFKMIDPPIVPEDHIKPRRGLICISITVVGFLLSVVFVLLKTAVINYKNIIRMDAD